MTRESDEEAVPTRWLQKQIDLILKNQEKFDAKIDQFSQEARQRGEDARLKISLLESRIDHLRNELSETKQGLEAFKKTLIGIAVTLGMTVATVGIQQWLK